MLETTLIIAIFIISDTDLMSIDKLLMKNAQVIYLFCWVGRCNDLDET